MFSGRIKKAAGAVLMIASIIWLAGVAAADEFVTDQGALTPILPLLVKTGIGLFVSVVGLRIIIGGLIDEDETDGARS